MKKYSIYVKFKDGQDLQFETDTNVRLAKPITTDNGIKVIMTENEYVLVVHNIAELEQIEL